MDAESAAQLARLIRGERVATLATLRAGTPNASFVLFLAEADWSAFVLYLSGLAWHTQDLERDASAALSIAQRDDGRADPQTLPRVTLRGAAARCPREDTGRLKTAWLARYPESGVVFELADFAFWRVVPAEARLVAGFGRTHTLSAQALRAAATTA